MSMALPIQTPLARAIGGPIRWGAQVSKTARLRKKLFGSGQQGVMYVPQPTVDGEQVLFQDSAGTTPVTADGQPVGLMLDLHKGLVRGPELVTNGTFDSDVSGWTAGAGWTISWSDGSAILSREAGSSITGAPYQDNVLTSGKWYEVTIDLIAVDDSMSVYLGSFDAKNQAIFTTTGSKKAVLRAAGSTLYVATTGTAPSSCTVDNISVRELPGNHATQTTAAAKPLYRTDGTLHWLDFDGVDDTLLNPHEHGDGRCILIVFKTADINVVLYGGRSEANARSYIGIDREPGLLRGSVGGNSTLVLSDASASTGEFNVGSLTHDGATVRLRLNSAEKTVAQGLNSPLPGSPSYIGALWDVNGTVTIPASCTISGLIDLTYVPSTDSIEKAETYLANLAGVTL